MEPFTQWRGEIQTELAEAEASLAAAATLRDAALVALISAREDLVVLERTLEPIARSMPRPLALRVAEQREAVSSLDQAHLNASHEAAAAERQIRELRRALGALDSVLPSDEDVAA